MPRELFWIIPLLVFYLVSSVLLLVALPAVGFLIGAIQFLVLALCYSHSLRGFLQYAKTALIILCVNQAILIGCLVLHAVLGFDSPAYETKQQMIIAAIFALVGSALSCFLHFKILTPILTQRAQSKLAG